MPLRFTYVITDGNIFLFYIFTLTIYHVFLLDLVFNRNYIILSVVQGIKLIAL